MKKAIKASVMFVLTTTVGFLAMSIPFRLFEELTQTQMRLMLAAECALCAIIYSAVFLSKEAKKQKELRNARLKERHEERVSLRAEEMRGIDFDGRFDIAA